MDPFSAQEAMDTDEEDAVNAAYSFETDQVPSDLDSEGHGKFIKAQEQKRKRKAAEQMEIAEATELVRKANGGDEEAIAEVQWQLKVEEGRRKVGPGHQHASTGVLYFWEHFKNPHTAEARM
jgi:hypothetical protein